MKNCSCRWWIAAMQVICRKLLYRESTKRKISTFWYIPWEERGKKCIFLLNNVVPLFIQLYREQLIAYTLRWTWMVGEWFIRLLLLLLWKMFIVKHGTFLTSEMDWWSAYSENMCTGTLDKHYATTQQPTVNFHFLNWVYCVILASHWQ